MPESIERIAERYRAKEWEQATERMDELGVPRVFLNGAYHAGLVERIDIYAGRICADCGTRTPGHTNKCPKRPAVEEQGDDREVGWTKAEYDAAPEMAKRLHTRILDLEDREDEWKRAWKMRLDELTTERHRRESAERERDEQIEVVNGLGERLDAERHRTQVAEGERDALRAGPERTLRQLVAQAQRYLSKRDYFSRAALVQALDDAESALAASQEET